MHCRMNLETQNTQACRKLIDYTKQGRPDMACNRGTPRQSWSSTMMPNKNRRLSLTKSYSSSSCSFDETNSVEFFLKIPPKITWRKNSTEDMNNSRRDAFLLVVNERIGALTKSNSDPSILSRKNRTSSLIIPSMFKKHNALTKSDSDPVMLSRKKRSSSLIIPSMLKKANSAKANLGCWIYSQV